MSERAFSHAKHHEYSGYRCPHCDYLHYPEDAHHYSEDWCETECGNCDGKFRVSVRHLISWTTWAGDSEHD